MESSHHKPPYVIPVPSQSLLRDSEPSLRLGSAIRLLPPTTLEQAQLFNPSQRGATFQNEAIAFYKDPLAECLPAHQQGTTPPSLQSLLPEIHIPSSCKPLPSPSRPLPIPQPQHLQQPQLCKMPSPKAHNQAQENSLQTGMYLSRALEPPQLPITQTLILQNPLLTRTPQTLTPEPHLLQAHALDQLVSQPVLTPRQGLPSQPRAAPTSRAGVRRLLPDSPAVPQMLTSPRDNLPVQQTGQLWTPSRDIHPQTTALLTPQAMATPPHSSLHAETVRPSGHAQQLVPAPALAPLRGNVPVQLQAQARSPVPQTILTTASRGNIHAQAMQTFSPTAHVHKPPPVLTPQRSSLPTQRAGLPQPGQVLTPPRGNIPAQGIDPSQLGQHPAQMLTPSRQSVPQQRIPPKPVNRVMTHVGQNTPNGVSHPPRPMQTTPSCSRAQIVRQQQISVSRAQAQVLHTPVHSINHAMPMQRRVLVSAPHEHTRVIQQNRKVVQQPAQVSNFPQHVSLQRSHEPVVQSIPATTTPMTRDVLGNLSNIQVLQLSQQQFTHVRKQSVDCNEQAPRGEQLTPTNTSTPNVSPVKVCSPLGLVQSATTIIPAPQPSVQRDATAIQYWKRLNALLASAKSFATEFQLCQSGLPRPSEIPRQIAYDFQGMTASHADAAAAKQSEQYRTSYTTRAAGDFIEYGVGSAHAVWVARVLSKVVGSTAPSVITIDIPVEGTHLDKPVEDVRIRLFEAEVSCLPVEHVEAILKRRRSMRKFKNRVDLCVKILMALEGRGRRPTQASLDRMKLQLEKADLQARIEVEREVARQERERQKLERLKKTGVKTEGSKKRRRQQSAQANFMMRFVKKDEKVVPEDEEVVVLHTSREGFAAPLAQDRDAMSVAWWLRAEMSATPHGEMENLFGHRKEGHLIANELVKHIADCKKRRTLAERRIHLVLREFRRERKMHTEDRTPMFAALRADVRGRGLSGPVKLLQFDENYRPAYYGTFSRRSRSVSGRRPLGKDKELDYECDSADEWDEDEEGEDLLDIEADKELASEEAELRRLYGSDDEDDDDFLDDGDVEGDEDDAGRGDDDENTTGTSSATEDASSPVKSNANGTEVIDLTLSTVNESKGEQGQKRSAKDDIRKRNSKRRKGMLKQSVVIHNLSIPDGEPSPLDRFPVTSFDGSQPIQMFNPYVYTSSDIVAEHLKAKPPSLRPSRPSNMDESTKLDLAAALMRTGSTKDKIVLQFCEHRKLRGLTVPTKAEIHRALGEIATKEKRDGDARASWHLTDQAMARKVAQMNNSAPRAIPHASAPMLVD